MHWHDRTPIYRQLAEQLQSLILDAHLHEGDALPSVRAIAAEYQLNPITVSKALQSLVDAEVVETRRGLGMFVLAGARARLLKQEREYFLKHEWPALAARLQRLELDPASLLASIKKRKE